MLNPADAAINLANWRQTFQGTNSSAKHRNHYDSDSYKDNEKF